MKLIKVISKHFPFGDYIALTFYPWLFIKEETKDTFTEADERHEITHALQQLETLWVLFLIIYGLEFGVKYLLCKFDSERACNSISFEQEAYEHEDEVNYNQSRKHYAWLKYVFSLNK